MKKLYALLLICLTISFGLKAQTLGVDTFALGNDNSNNYGGSWTTTNQGTGFSDWVFDTATPNGGFAGRFIASFSAALDVGGNSFGMFANSGNGAVSGATTTMPQAMKEGDSFTVSIGVNFRDGNKGFDLRDASNSTIINLNVGSDQYNLTGTPGLFSNSYDSNTVFTCTFTQNASDVSWTIVRSGGQSGTQSGTIGSISPGTIENVRFYNVSAGTNNDGGGARNLFVNSLEFGSMYTIDSNLIVDVTADTTVPYLDVRTNNELNIAAGNVVTVTGDFDNTGSVTIASTSTTYGSLIVNGSSTGDVTYNRFVNSNILGNDLISPPVGGQTWSDFLDPVNATALLDNGDIPTATYAFAPFDKVTGSYTNYDGATSATLTSGTGYRAATDSGETLAFTGTVQTGTVSVDIQNSGPEFAQWNLVGNPYPSYLNVQDFLTHEVSPGVSNLQLFDAPTAAIYGYDGDATDGWAIYNMATTTPSTVITPGQGFFVSADATNAGLHDMEFTTAMQASGSGDDFIAGRQGGLVYLTLNASTSSQSYNTDVYFNPNASLGFDLGFDAELFSVPSFALYSLLVEDNIGEPIALQALNVGALANTTVPLGLNAPQGQQLTFTISTNELPPTTEVFLDDTEASVTTLLNSGDYTVTPSADISGTGRFFLRFVDDSFLSNPENEIDQDLSITALSKSKEILVSGNILENTVLDLYDILGKKVLSTSLDSTTTYNKINVASIGTGVYIVNVHNNTNTTTKKVIIK